MAGPQTARRISEGNGQAGEIAESGRQRDMQSRVIGTKKVRRSACQETAAGGQKGQKGKAVSAPQIACRAGSARAAECRDGEVSGCGVGDAAPHDLRLGSYERPCIGGKDDDGDVSSSEMSHKESAM
jgi:hypothetical protein